MTAAAILAWHDFFITMAQVGATLAGLLFVGLTISLPHLLHARGYLARAFSALFLQFETLLIGLFGLVPGQPASLLGTEIFIAAIAILIGITVFAHNFREDESSHVLGSRWSRRIRAAFVIGGTVLPALAGVGLTAGEARGLYLLVPAQVCSLYLSIGNAWVFAVEIPRRKEGA
ncbi:MAG: hypothetical protein JOZ55_00660 [Alphaproteobacteria bacterium]|nr:hypothetical protein [Alphaproteobacteria bacterium]